MLKIFNTLTRKKESFKPIKKNQVSFYHCGPTVYWTQHIGNMRAVVLSDLIASSFDYLGYKVKLVRNYTDVGHLTSDEDSGEDKISKSAQKENKTPKEIAEKYIEIFEQDIKNLNVDEDLIWKKPLATKHIKEIASMVQALIDGGYAYATDLAIYFNISKFKNYTRLSGQDLEKNISKAGKGEVGDKNKKNSADFALWFFKAGVHKNALQTWKMNFKDIKQSVEEGFPGWHIECSAMSQKYFGDTLDIHMGGIEHIQVHHTNEIAQSEATTGKKFVNYWLHNEHLTVDNGKMAKSGGTAFTVEEIKKKGYDPLILRYFFLSAHYRSKQNFTWEALDSAQSSLNNLRERIISLRSDGKVNKKYKNKFIKAIEDDFNIPQILAIVWEVLKSGLDDGDKRATVLDFDKILGLDLQNIEAIKIPKKIEKLAKQRQQARENKDWKEADKIRQEIEKNGYVINDGLGGAYDILKKL